MIPAAARSAAVFRWYALAYRRTWWATVTTAFLNPVFFLLAVGLLLGRLIDRAGPDLGGLSYLEFVAPGLLVAAAMQIGVNEGSFPVMAGVRWVRSYHAVVATPVSVPELVAGLLGWVAARVLVAASVFAAVAAAAGAFPSPVAALAPLAALLTGVAFAAPMAALAATAERGEALTGVLRFLILPLFLFSGTFFPLDRLPDWLQPLAWATPLWHGVALCRDLATGGGQALPSLAHAGYLAALVLAGALLAVRALERRLLQ